MPEIRRPVQDREGAEQVTQIHEEFQLACAMCRFCIFPEKRKKGRNPIYLRGKTGLKGQKREKPYIFTGQNGVERAKKR